MFEIGVWIFAFAIVALLTTGLVLGLGKLLKSRREAKVRPAAQDSKAQQEVPPVSPAVSLAEIFADQILAGKISKGFPGDRYVSTRGDCTNCHGKKARWSPKDADEHLQRPRLVEAIQNRELCGDCIEVLLDTVVSLRASVDQPSPSPAPAPTAQSAPADQSKDDKGDNAGWWPKRKKRIKFLVVALMATGILIGGTALFARVFPQPGLNELKLYLYVLIGVAGLIWLNNWLAEKEKSKK